MYVSCEIRNYNWRQLFATSEAKNEVFNQNDFGTRGDLWVDSEQGCRLLHLFEENPLQNTELLEIKGCQVIYEEVD